MGDVVEVRVSLPDVCASILIITSQEDEEDDEEDDDEDEEDPRPRKKKVSCLTRPLARLTLLSSAKGQAECPEPLHGY